MKRKQIRISILFIALLILSNAFSGYINVFSDGLFNTYLYQTENAEFEFTAIPSKGRDIGMMERQFSNFKKNSPEYKGLKLFRTFKREPLKFWNWYLYLTNGMYQYEYHEKVDLESRKSHGET